MKLALLIVATLVAVLYSKGLGIDKDYIQAYMWFSLCSANSQGRYQKEAAKSRGEIAKNMSPQQLAVAQRLVSDWVPQKEK